jgi:hypothetical protein
MHPEQYRRQVAGLVSRRALTASTYDANAHTIELTAATDAPILTPGWRIGIDGNFLEILDMSPEAADLSAVAAGNCPLLNAHQAYDVDTRLGAITQARVDGSQLIVQATFGLSAAAVSAEAEMAGPVPIPVSLGFRVNQYVFERFEPDKTPVYRATNWSVTEVSLVPIAADANAGVRADNGSRPCVILETRAMTPEEIAAAAALAAAQTEEQRAAAQAEVTRAAAAESERQRIAAAAEAERVRIAALTPAPVVVPAPAAAPTMAEGLQLLDQARSLGVEEQTRAAFTVAGASSDSIRAAILAAAAVRQAASTGQVVGGAIVISRDERDTTRAGMQAAILLGIGGEVRGEDGERSTVLEGQARAYRGMTLSEMAATVIGERSAPRSLADREAVFTRAFHTTSDFPNILNNALNQRLLQQYQTATPTYRRIASEMTFMDFRPHNMVRAGDFPQPVAVGQAGEIKYGTFGDKAEVVSVSPYAIQFSLSRQLLVNDRLGAIEQVLASQGTQVALFEEKTFYAMKNVNSGNGPALVEAGGNVFASGRANLAASGTAITNTDLGAGRAALRKMKNLQGDKMGLPPSILLVSPDKETEAAQILTQLQGANQASTVNIFSGKLDTVIAGQNTGNAWELYVDPTFGTNWVWGLLDGYLAPRLKVEEMFGVQGVRVSLEHDFGCGAQDFRFGYRNPGN